MEDPERVEDTLRGALSDAIMHLGPEATKIIVDDELDGVVVIWSDGRVEKS